MRLTAWLGFKALLTANRINMLQWKHIKESYKVNELTQRTVKTGFWIACNQQRVTTHKQEIQNYYKDNIHKIWIKFWFDSNQIEPVLPNIENRI